MEKYSYCTKTPLIFTTPLTSQLGTKLPNISIFLSQPQDTTVVTSSPVMIFKLRLDLDCYQRLALALTSSLCLASLLSLTSLSLASWLAILAPGAASLAVLQSSLQLEVGDKSVLVTGCDTGFGLALAKHLRGQYLNKENLNMILLSRSRLHRVCWLLAG